MKRILSKICGLFKKTASPLPESLEQKFKRLNIHIRKYSWMLLESKQEWHRTYKFHFESQQLRTKFMAMMHDYSPAYPNTVKWMEYIKEFEPQRFTTPKKEPPNPDRPVLLPAVGGRQLVGDWGSMDQATYVIEARCIIPTPVYTRNGNLFNDPLDRKVQNDFEDHFFLFVERSLAKIERDTQPAREHTKQRKTPMPLYDTVVITPETTKATFFETSLAEGKSQVYTNMPQSFSLNNARFEAHTLRIIFEPDALPADIKAISDGYFRLFIGNKDRLVVPIYMLMTGEDSKRMESCCDDCKDASKNNVFAVTCGRPDQRGTYVLAEPLDLIPNQHFRAEISNFGKVSQPTNVRFYLDGTLKETD